MRWALGIAEQNPPEPGRSLFDFQPPLSVSDTDVILKNERKPGFRWNLHALALGQNLGRCAHNRA